LKERGGSILAVSVDTAEARKQFAESQGVDFPLLGDRGARVIRDYGLLHQGAGLEAPDIAIPAQFLLDGNRCILWRHVARRVPDRADPQDVVRVIRKHWPVGR
jgi:peroxiredoxin